MESEAENIIKRFLYGELPDEERSSLESRFVADGDLFDEIKIVEDELIEKYVRGWMDSAEGSKFEQRFLTTKRRRDRVAFSRQLFSKINEQNGAAAVPLKKNEGVIAEDISVWEKLAAFWLAPKGLAAGAFAVLLMAVGGWILYQNFSDRQPEFARKESDANIKIATNIVTPIPVVSPKDDKIGPLANGTPGNENIQPDNPTPNKENPPETPAEKPKPADPKPVAANAVLALFAGTLRSDGRNNELNLPKDARSATLQLNLPSIDYKSFEAQLTDADGSVLFRRPNIRPRRSTIIFTVPAQNLKRGDYNVKLSGTNESGKNESVADFQFRVVQ